VSKVEIFSKRYWLYKFSPPERFNICYKSVSFRYNVFPPVPLSSVGGFSLYKLALVVLPLLPIGISFLYPQASISTSSLKKAPPGGS
jgi:hypothetical protein